MNTPLRDIRSAHYRPNKDKTGSCEEEQSGSVASSGRASTSHINPGNWTPVNKHRRSTGEPFGASNIKTAQTVFDWVSFSCK